MDDDDSVSAGDPGSLLALADELIDRVLGAADGDEELDATEAADVRQAWQLAVQAHSAAADDPEHRWWSSLAMGRAAVVGRAADLPRATLESAADALRVIVHDLDLPSDLCQLGLELLCDVLLGLVDEEESAQQRGTLLEEVMASLSAARSSTSDDEAIRKYTSVIGHQAYRGHLLADEGDRGWLDIAIAELAALANANEADAEDLLTLANAYEDRYLDRGEADDRASALRAASDVIALDRVPEDLVAGARSLRGRLQLELDETGNLVPHREAIADLAFAVDILGAGSFDGLVAARTLTSALIELGVHDRGEAMLLVSCLEVLRAIPGQDLEDEEIQNHVATMIIESARLGQRWDEAYRPALDLIRERADGNPHDVRLAVMAAVGCGLRPAMLFTTEPRASIEPLLTEAQVRIERALDHPEADPFARELHGLALAVLWLSAIPEDWSPSRSLGDALEHVDDLLPGARRRLAQRALEHAQWLREHDVVDAAFLYPMLVLLRLMVEDSDQLSDEEVARLRRTPVVDTDMTLLMGLEQARGGLLAREANRRRDVPLLREALAIQRRSIREIEVDHPARPHARLALAQSMLWLARMTADGELIAAAHEQVRTARGEGSGQRLSAVADELTRELLSAGRLRVAPVAQDGNRPPREWAAQQAKEALALRGHDDREAQRRARAALRTYARCVLGQPQTTVALAIADEATGWAHVVADWALQDGRPEDAVDALERGRAMTLYAATAASQGAAILRDAGRHELADAWVKGTEDPNRVEEILIALGDTVGGRVLHVVPDPPEIASALWDVGVDALVYLVRLQRPDHSWRITALIIRPGAQVEVLNGPPSDKSPLVRYRAAYEQAFGVDPVAVPDSAPSVQTDPSGAVEAWRLTLGELADWAEESVGQTLRAHVADWDLPHTPRLILVPIGELAVVPWSVARRRVSDVWRYLLHDVRISSAASARQVIDVSRRPRLAQDRVAVIANPGGDLPYAARLASTLREQFYPDAQCAGLPARRFGPHRGSPEDILKAMPARDAEGAGLLQVSAHAVLDTAPENSRILLADGASVAVGQLLAQARQRSPRAAGGLAVLACCGTDLTQRVPDEALTLATAFLAAGAVSVIGTRWPVADGAAAIACYMVHRRLAEGAEPSTALRDAQLWLLDEHRALPTGLPQSLDDVAAGAALSDPVVWAAFTHHGR